MKNIGDFILNPKFVANALTITYIYTEITRGYENFIESFKLHYKEKSNHCFLVDSENESRQNVIAIYISAFDDDKISEIDCQNLNQVMANELGEQIDREKIFNETITIYIATFKSKDQYDIALSFYDQMKTAKNVQNPQCIITHLDCNSDTAQLLNQFKTNKN